MTAMHVSAFIVRADGVVAARCDVAAHVAIVVREIRAEQPCAVVTVNDVEVWS